MRQQIADLNEKLQTQNQKANELVTEVKELTSQLKNSVEKEKVSEGKN